MQFTVDHQFANDLLAKGRGEGEVCRICEISSAIINDMKTAGLELHAKDIIVTQRQVFKYRNHPKTTKGANIPVEDYGIIETALKGRWSTWQSRGESCNTKTCGVGNSALSNKKRGCDAPSFALAEGVEPSI